MSTTGEDPYRIDALQKKAAAQYDLMKSGSGTPWEERGSAGMIAAYFRTVFASMFTPASLFDRIRRPETNSDTNLFAWTCGCMWSVGLILNDIILYRHDSALSDNPPFGWTVNFSANQFWLETILRAALVPIGLFVFLKITVSVFSRLSAGELRAAPRTLVQNLFAYCLGPSIIAIIPTGAILGSGYWWVSMVIAAAWILVNMIIAARARLHMSVSGAAINAILAWICGVAVIAAACVALWLLWVFVIEGHSFEMIPPVAHPGRP